MYNRKCSSVTKAFRESKTREENEKLFLMPCVRLFIIVDIVCIARQFCEKRNNLLLYFRHAHSPGNCQFDKSSHSSFHTICDANHLAVSVYVRPPPEWTRSKVVRLHSLTIFVGFAYLERRIAVCSNSHSHLWRRKCASNAKNTPADSFYSNILWFISIFSFSFSFLGNFVRHTQSSTFCTDAKQNEKKRSEEKSPKNAALKGIINCRRRFSQCVCVCVFGVRFVYAEVNCTKINHANWRPLKLLIPSQENITSDLYDSKLKCSMTMATQIRSEKE